MVLFRASHLKTSNSKIAAAIFWISIGFLIFALWKSNYLHIPRIFSASFLVASLLSLTLVMLAGSLPWYHILKKNQIQISGYDAIKSTGLYVFTKYIPGKVWVIVGRAAWVAKEKNQPIAKLSYISMQIQVLGLWYGLITGIAGLFFATVSNIYLYAAILLWISMSLILFIPWFQIQLERILTKIRKHKVQLPVLNFKTSIKMAPEFLLFWLGTAFSLYLLGLALTPQGISLSSALCFNLAAVMGVLALFVPGGIGVREALLASLLVLSGMSPAEATTFSLSSRLWFLWGEFSHFLIALLIKDPADV